MSADPGLDRPGTEAARHDWLDADAGPVVRPYTMTRGRVRPVAGGFNLVSFIRARVPATVFAEALEPEHRAILTAARTPITVADLASHLDLALGVVRVLLGDLLQEELISVYQPPPLTSMTDERILLAVINGLRAL
jgi:hypothetical protein